uniref:hypothetical protein n=1 Tax=uncultured Sphingobium sp. TaxID=316087 RepID=UPI00263814E3
PYLPVKGDSPHASRYAYSYLLCAIFLRIQNSPQRFGTMNLPITSRLRQPGPRRYRCPRMACRSPN